MSLENLIDFVSDFEARFGAKPTRIGLKHDDFNNLEKSLEDQSKYSYTACYQNGSRIRMLGLEVYPCR
jgi:hypothetical protein